MHSTLNPKPNDDPHDVVVVPPDAVRVAPVDDELSNLLHQAARRHSDMQIHTGSGSTAASPIPLVDTTFRPSAANDVVSDAVNDVLGSPDGPSIGRRVGRAFAALLLAACIGAAAIGWQAFGYAGKKMIVKWTPQFVLTSLPLEKWGLSAQSNPPDVEADAASPQPAPLAPTAPEGVAAKAAAPSPDSAQLLQSMARDLANVSQEVELLKASIAELKSSQQQISRDVVKTSEQKASEQNARARVAALPPRPAVPRPRKPIPPYPPTQAYPPAQAAAAPPLSQPAAPYYPPRQPEPLPPVAAQPPVEPGFSSVPRPPMPVQ
jgi:hypothetical protein